jgi:hypothetical protein
VTLLSLYKKLPPAHPAARRRSVDPDLPRDLGGRGASAEGVLDRLDKTLLQ